jgi:hypothetical protein
MKRQSGKITLGTIVILALLVYGGFVAFKFITVRVGKTEIKNDIINRLGMVRGQDFTEDKGVELIEEVLVQHGFLNVDEKLEDAYQESEDDHRENPPQRAAYKRSDGSVYIEVELNPGRTQIKFLVRYKVLVDLIVFKSTQSYEIKEEVLNYN